MRKFFAKLILFIVISFALLFLVLLIIALFREDTTQIAKDEFSKYYNGKNEVALNIDDDLYFEDYILEEKDINPNIRYLSIIIREGKIYFITTTSNQDIEGYVINVHSCGLKGENQEIVFSKPIGTKKDLYITTQDDSYFIKYVKDGTTFIDQYTISTNEYKNIASGKKLVLSDYVPKEPQSKYSVEIIENESITKHGKFIITDLQSNQKIVIDDEYLSGTEYIESLKLFNYGPLRYDISNGHILLTYSIGAGDGWNDSHLVFEYVFEEDRLEYKMLVFPYDSLPIKIFYAG